MAECSGIHYHHNHSKGSSKTSPSVNSLLEKVPPPPAESYNLDFFEDSDAAEYPIAKITLPEYILQDNWDRRVRYYWIAFWLQIATYPLHALLFLFFELLKSHLIQTFVMIFPMFSFFYVALSLVFKLNNKQAAAELTLIWSGGVVVFYGGLTYVLCLVFLEGSHLPNDGNDVTQYPNPLIIWSLCATAGTSLIVTRIAYLGFVYQGERSIFGVSEGGDVPEVEYRAS